MFSSIFKFVLNLFRGSSDSKPQPGHGQPHRPPRPPQHAHSQPHRPPQHVESAPQQHHTPQSTAHQDPNQINQSNEYYLNLRARANQEGDAMAKCFEQSHQAYASGNGAEAKALSNKGKEHQRRMEDFNKQASDWIFTENNKDSKPGEIDLHGLYVKEAIARTDEAIESAKRRGVTEIHLIVGKGLHSKGGAAKIKPAIEDLMRKHRLLAEPDPHNAGVLMVQINSRSDRGFDPDEIARRLAREDEGCTIM